MARRRILHKLKLTEISAVDRPCQEHAKVTIMKRDDPDQEDTMAKAKKDEELMEGEDNPLEEEAEGDVPPRKRKKMSKGNPTAGSADNEGDDMTDDTQKVADLQSEVDDLEKMVGDLTKKLETATAANSRTLKAVEQEEQIEKLTAELREAKKLLAKQEDASEINEAADKIVSKANRDKIEEAASEGTRVRKGNDEIIVIEDQEIRKSQVGPAQFAIMKAQQERIKKAEEAIAKERDEREMAELRKRADDNFPHVPGSTNERAMMLKALNGMDKDLRKCFEAVFEASEKLSKAAFEKVGSKGEGKEGGARNGGVHDFEKRAMEIAKRDGVSRSEGMSRARAEYPKEYADYQGNGSN